MFIGNHFGAVKDCIDRRLVMSQSLEEELKQLRDERQKKFDEENWEGALEIHDKILELSPTALRYANRASILYRIDRLEEAIESYKKALEIDPSLKRAKADLERLENQLKKQSQDSNLPLPKEVEQKDLPMDEVNQLRESHRKSLEEEDWSSALQTLKKLLELEPSAVRYANQGSILYRLGKWKEAIDSYEKALELDPSLKRAQADLKRLEDQVKEEGELAVHVEQTTDNQLNKQIEKLRKLRQEKVEAGDWKEALKIHDQVLELEPTALRYANRGALLYRMGNQQEALSSYKKALGMDAHLKKAQDAINHLEAIVEEESLLAISVEDSGNSEFSIEEKHALIKEYRDERQKHIAKKNWDKALEFHDKILEIEPSALRQVNKGSMLYRMGRLDDAIAAYHSALEMDPDLKNAQKDLQRMEAEVAKKKADEEKLADEKARAEKEELEKKISAFKEERQRKIEQDDWEGALAAQSQILDLEPTSLRYTNQGSILYRLGRVNQAILAYRKALDIEPSLEQAMAGLEKLKENEMDRLRVERQTKMQEEQWEEALCLHDIVLALEPSALRYANRGSLLYRLERFQEAIASYQKALEMDPSLEKAKEDMERLQEELPDTTVLVAVPQEFEEDEEEFFTAEPIEVEEAEILSEKKEPITAVPETSTSKACLAQLSGHQGDVTMMEVSPDGSFLVSAAKDQNLRIWDNKSYQEKHVLNGHDDWIRSIVISPDGKKIFSASDDWTARIWDVQSGRCESVLKGHTMPVLNMAFLSEKNLLATCSRDKTVRVWDSKEGTLVTTLEGHEDWVSSLAVLGDKLVSGSFDKTLRLWDTNSWECLRVLEGHNGWVESILPVNKEQVVSCGDKSMRVWNLSTGNCLATFDDHSDFITCMKASSDGKKLVSTSQDRSLIVWNLQDFSLQKTIRSDPDFIQDFFFTLDNQSVIALTQDGKLLQFSLTGEKKILRDSVGAVQLIRDSLNNSIICAEKEYQITVWEL